MLHHKKDQISNMKDPKELKQPKQPKIKSSLRLKSKTPLEKDQIHKINTILMHLNNHNDSIDFRQPVDWKGLQLYDYLDVVKHPMDLSTINIKLRDKKYKTVQSVLNDIQLIWDNCKLYNSKQSVIYDIADKLQLSFRRMVRNYLPNLKVATVTSSPIIPITDPPFIVIYKPQRQNQIQPPKPKPQPKLQPQIQPQTQPQSQQKIQPVQQKISQPTLTPLETKRQLFTKIFKLSENNLQKLINSIKQLCPKQFVQGQQGWAKIQVQHMQMPIIMKLYNMVKQMPQANLDQQNAMQQQK